MFPKIGVFPPKWMVYNGKPYFLMDDLGVPLFSETPKGWLRLCGDLACVVSFFSLAMQIIRIFWD